jgi:outer membrane protein assembly factor BamA
VTLGTSAELFAGAQHRDEDGAGEKVEALARAEVSAAFEPWREAYLTLDLAGGARTHGGDTEAWSAQSAVHAYRQLDSRHTLALSLTYDEVFEGENLPVQLNLGEDSGLRGYPAREFAGRERYRLNLEDRFDTGLSSSSFDLGLVGFYDVGWISDDGITGAAGPGLDDPFQSVGLGLRIGSNEVLGRNVVRLDLAFPLDDFGGEDYGPSLSFAFGQVFGFHGNQSTLATR